MNYGYSEYNDREKQVPWLKVAISLLAFVIIVIIILLFMRGCQGGNLNDDLVQAGKDYYTKYPEKLPSEIAQCYTVSLQTLLDEELLKAKKYDTCDVNGTYVKVCYLENKSYQYVGVLDCEDETSKFGMWQDGTLSDIVADKTDVRFRFIGQKLSLGTKYYYPGDKLNATDVIEYYAKAPSLEYTGKEDEQTGYKWYVQKETTEYYNNGAYVSSQPSGYPNKGDSKQETHYSESKPSEASYRTIKEETLYRYKNVAKPFKYICKNSSNETSKGDISDFVIYGNTVCALRTDGFTTFAGLDYSCDGTTILDSKEDCSGWTEWTSTACQNSVLNGIECESKTGYTYTDTVWQWYKKGSANYYFPSNSTSALEENTYYISQPVAGAVKDENTKATVHKYYKVVKDENVTNPNLEEWLDVTDGYVSEQDLITTFQGLGYEVNSLSDIQKIEEIRYQYQMQYRNVQE